MKGQTYKLDPPHDHMLCAECERLEAENERLHKVHDLCHALARWMAKHDDICPLDDEGEALLAPFYARSET